VSAAYKLPKDTANREDAIDKALIGAAQVPLETARLCAEAAELAATVAAKGNSNAVTDAGVAALLAAAGCRGAVYNVRINVGSLSDRSIGSILEQDANELLAKADLRSKEACDFVERALSS